MQNQMDYKRFWRICNVETLYGESYGTLKCNFRVIQGYIGEWSGGLYRDYCTVGLHRPGGGTRTPHTTLFINKVHVSPVCGICVL